MNAKAADRPASSILGLTQKVAQKSMIDHTENMYCILIISISSDAHQNCWCPLLLKTPYLLGVFKIAIFFASDPPYNFFLPTMSSHN